jgi:hypothetical protein
VPYYGLRAPRHVGAAERRTGNSGEPDFQWNSRTVRHSTCFLRDGFTHLIQSRNNVSSTERYCCPGSRSAGIGFPEPNVRGTWCHLSGAAGLRTPGGPLRRLQGSLSGKDMGGSCRWARALLHCALAWWLHKIIVQMPAAACAQQG